VSVVVDMGDAQRIVFGTVAELHADEVFAVAPTVEGCEAYGLEIVVGIEIPFAGRCEAGIFALHSREV